MSNIKELCSCSICFNLIDDQIYQCEHGHICCKICINNINHCGTCRTNNYKIRNLVLETLRDEYLKSNQNTDNKNENINLDKDDKNKKDKDDKNKKDKDDKNIINLNENNSILYDLNNYDFNDDISDNLKNLNIKEKKINTDDDLKKLIMKNYNSENLYSNLMNNLNNLEKVSC